MQVWVPVRVRGAAQSNMEFVLSSAFNATAEVAAWLDANLTASDIFVPVAPPVGYTGLVMLAPAFAGYSDAKAGPLQPGDLGVVLSSDGSRVQVQANSGKKW